MGKKHSFRDALYLKAAGDTTDVLEYPQRRLVLPRYRYHITRVSFEDATTALTEVQVNVKRGGVTFYVMEQVAPAAGRLYWTTEEIVLTEGERLSVYFSGATADDLLWVYLEGYYLEVD
jgi:hypothetical protein